MYPGPLCCLVHEWKSIRRFLCRKRTDLLVWFSIVTQGIVTQGIVTSLVDATLANKVANWLPSAARYRVAYTRWHRLPATYSSAYIGKHSHCVTLFLLNRCIERRPVHWRRDWCIEKGKTIFLFVGHNAEASIISGKVACNCLRSSSINSKRPTSRCLRYGQVPELRVSVETFSRNSSMKTSQLSLLSGTFSVELNPWDLVNLSQ